MHFVLQTSFFPDFTYLGCFSDDDRRESLPDLVFCDKPRDPYTSCHNTCGPRSENYCESQDMKVELCRDICADQNMKYFGLQAGSRCLCGGEFAPYDKSGIATGRTKTCDQECSGNSSQTCGGNSLTSVYQIHGKLTSQTLRMRNLISVNAFKIPLYRSPFPRYLIHTQ